MEAFRKEFQISEQSKVVFLEYGIRTEYISDEDWLNKKTDNPIYHFCPYKNIKKFEVDKFISMLSIEGTDANGESFWGSYCFYKWDKHEIKAAINYAKRCIASGTPDVSTVINDNSDSWFKYVFPSCLAFLFFWIAPDIIFWKLLGAAMTFGLGFLISSWLEKKFSATKAQSTSKAIKVILCVLPILIAMIIGFGHSSFRDDRKMCDWCEKRPVTHNSRFCDQCYDKLF
ncbi:MAG: hypothetical protein IKB04_00190 [Clostridia bacterium]|nr:hypothetical protein [Clostridia bacterium]